MTSSFSAAMDDWVNSQLADCRLCPRNCRVNRLRGERGWCGAGAQPEYFMEYVHYGEESELAPSHTIYLTGCNLHCLFCHTALERKVKCAEALTPERLAAIIARGRSEGARNLNLLGGEPMVNLPALLKILAAVEELPPLVWNTNLYCTAEALAMVNSLADIYLVDLKFGNNRCSGAVAEAGDYWDVVRARLKELREGDQGKIIIRHLVLPGHLDCCTRPALSWIAQELPELRVSLKLDYLVMPPARQDERLGRFLTSREVCQAEEMAEALGLRLVLPRDAGERCGVKASATSKASDCQASKLPMDVELVISPNGEIYLHHPTREAVSVARQLNSRRESSCRVAPDKTHEERP